MKELGKSPHVYVKPAVQGVVTRRNRSDPTKSHVEYGEGAVLKGFELSMLHTMPGTLLYAGGTCERALSAER